jgi:bifunctional UDP-N-acetylglucosamine pyrophosphorylase/glucosamine-1-phosphate N-acetyltransferase
MNNINKEISNNKIHFLILAAGKGTRMKSGLPKVLHKVTGRTLIAHILNLTKTYANANTTTIISPNQPDIEAEILSVAPNSKIIYQTEQLGTGHAVRESLPHIPSDAEYVVVLYGDTPFITTETINKMLGKLASEKNSTLCVLAFEFNRPNEYGKVIVENGVEGGKLKKIVEHKDANEAERKVNLCNSGIFAFKTNNLNNIINKISNQNKKGEYYLTDAVEIALSQNLQAEFETTNENEVMGINSQAERDEAEHIRQNYLRKSHMDNGVILLDSTTVYFSEDTKIAAGVVVHQNVVFGKNVEVESGVEIKPFCHIEGAKIGKNSSIGPFARLRAGTDLGADNKIGNFVETKKVKTAEGVKISHLSYIGDAVIGAEVNIGAGTITCNYDGKNKFVTTIEDGAFIGSNSALVAPVKIGYNAIVGAGSTIFKDVEAKSVTVNPKTQIILKKND